MDFQKWKLISSEFYIVKFWKRKKEKLLYISSLWSLYIFLRSFKFFVYMHLNKKNHWKILLNVHKKYIFWKIFVHTFWIRNRWKCSFVYKFWNIWKSLKISFVHIFSFGKLVHIVLKYCLWKVYWKNHHL